MTHVGMRHLGWLVVAGRALACGGPLWERHQQQGLRAGWTLPQRLHHDEQQHGARLPGGSEGFSA